MTNRRLFMGCLLASLVSATAGARVPEDWPMSKLTKKADVVVVASVKFSRKASGAKAPKPYNDLVGVETGFQVLAVLKGKVNGDKLTLLHFRKPKPEECGQSPDINGPCLVEFEVKKKTKYLLFLIRRPDGRYECVSGQIDPDLSVCRLLGPLDE